jgi:signal transduction histidine kinase
MPNIVRSVRQITAHSTPFQANPASVDAAFDAVFDSSAEALLVMDSTGVIYRANRRGRELLRLQEGGEHAILGDLLSCPQAEHIKTFWASPNFPGQPQALEASLVNGFPVRIALRAILPDSGHMLLCLEEGSIVERADAKWRHLQAELRSLLDSVEAGVLLVDPTGRLRFSNARFGELFGLGMREIADMATFQALHEVIADRFRDTGSFSAPWNSYTSGAGEPVHDELELTRPSRKIIERFSRPVLDAAGRDAGWLELYSDVTGERQIQSKMLQTEKMAALGQLVSGIAHELNNPLTAIMGYTQLLLGHGLADSQLSEANKIFQEAERARRIVKNLLYFARENKPERIRVDINEIVERTLALRSYELKVKINRQM